MEYKLLTPGPLTTKLSVRKAMLEDSCTWDNEYKNKVKIIREKLLEIAGVSNEYTSILMQGSGSFSVESAINSLISKDDHLLVLSNGAYGERIYEIACKTKKNVETLKSSEIKTYDIDVIDEYLKNNTHLTHLAVVHCETTTGILNNLEEVAKVAKKYNLVLIVDAMSSFGGIEIDFEKNDIDCLISSANKCLEGVPGFGFVIVKKSIIEKTKNNACSLSLDLYEQYMTFENESNKFRFTSPTHVILAFLKALEEYEIDGGLIERSNRYKRCQKLLVNKMRELNFKECINEKDQSPIITTFYYHDNPKFTFEGFYEYLKQNGYIIYPGKLSNLEVFRIGNIGQIYEEDIINLCKHIKNYLEKEIK